MAGFTKQDWDQFSDLMETQLGKFKRSAEEIATSSARKAISEFQHDNCMERGKDIDAMKRTLLMAEVPIKIGRFKRNIRVSFVVVFGIVVMFIFL